jgi:hypothetical protein
VASSDLTEIAFRGMRISDVPDHQVAAFKAALHLAGIFSSDVKWAGSTSNLDLVRIWVKFLHQLRRQFAAWGQEYDRFATPAWCAIDDQHPGDVEMRLADGRVEFRERLLCECAASRSRGACHDSERCPNCWHTLTTLEGSAEQVLLTPYLRVRVWGANGVDPHIRVTIQHRTLAEESDQPVHDRWGEEWQLITTPCSRWTRLNGDVRICRSAYGGNYLVSRAVSHRLETQWSTPNYIPNPGSHWRELAPGIEFKQHPESGTTIIVRISLDYRTELVTEPVWDETQCFGSSDGVGYGDVIRFHDVSVEPAHRGHGYSVVRVRVASDPQHNAHLHPYCGCFSGRGAEIELGSETDKWILIAPGVRARGNSLLVYLQHGSPEPEPSGPNWQAPFRLTLGTDPTYLAGGQIRAWLSHNVQIEVLQPTQAWSHFGSYSWRLGPVTTEPIPGVRFTISERQLGGMRGTDVQAEIQCNASISSFQDDGWTVPFLVPLRKPHAGHDQPVPGFQVYTPRPGTLYVKVWAPDPGVSDAGIGSTGLGGWIEPEIANLGDRWFEVTLAAGPVARVRYRFSNKFNNVLEIQTLARERMLAG